LKRNIRLCAGRGQEGGRYFSKKTDFVTHPIDIDHIEIHHRGGGFLPQSTPVGIEWTGENLKKSTGGEGTQHKKGGGGYEPKGTTSLKKM